VTYIWDTCTGELLETLRKDGGAVWSMAFTHDRHGFFSYSSDNTLKYWDVSRLANGSGGRPNSPGAPGVHDTLDGKKDIDTREGNSACTMDFIGHKVCVELADRGCV